MKNIEVEIRSFLTEEQYHHLLDFFEINAEKKAEDDQVTYYYKTDQDVRIQKNNSYSKIWLKKGKLHDEAREEIEIRCAKDDFTKLESLFSSLGYGIEIKWFRKRKEFLWSDVSVALDCTQGYGYILELEKVTEETEKEATLFYLKEKMKELGIEQTPKGVFEEKYNYYKKHWKTII